LSICWKTSRVFSTVGDEFSDDVDFDLCCRSLGPVLSADFLKSLFVIFGDASLGDSNIFEVWGGRTLELSGDFDFDEFRGDALFRSLLTHIFDGEGDFSDDARLASDLAGDPSLLFGSGKLNLSDF
jgi:hypothetical protein